MSSSTPSSSSSTPEPDIAYDYERAIVPTSFDTYFTLSASRAQTSTSVFSVKVPPLSADEFTHAITHPTFPSPVQVLPEYMRRVLMPTSDTTEHNTYDNVFPRFLLELDAGFNILCYGFGSKRTILNHFAKHYCARRGDVLVVNAFRAEFALRELVSALDRVHTLSKTSATSKSAKSTKEAPKRPIYIIVHNIDAPTLRSASARATIASLIRAPHVHLIASVDHINAPLLWTMRESSSRNLSTDANKPLSHDDFDSCNSAEQQQTPTSFNWLWHDLTTLMPYTSELSAASSSALPFSGASPLFSTYLPAAYSGTAGAPFLGAGSSSANPTAQEISESAALHILTSVTRRAQQLFLILAERQLQSETGVPGTIPSVNLDSRPSEAMQNSTSYETLLQNARANFVATSDTALKALLGEFRDHGLVVGSTGGTDVGGSSGGGELLWIPMRSDRLMRVVQDVKTFVEKS